MAWRSDRPWGTALVLASVGGALGGIAGTLWGFGLQGSFLDSNVGAAGVGGLCAGLGWVAAAALGLARSKDGRAPTRTWVWVLRAGATAFLATGILVAHSLSSLDTHRPPADLGPMQRDVLIDAVLAAATLLVCARPAVPVRRMLVGVTSAAAIALIVLAAVAAEAIPEGRSVAWYDAW